MATLDDLLALLPDNATGQIDAADLREIVTAIFEHLDGVNGRLGSLETAGSGEDSISVTGEWQVNSNAGQAPGGAQVTSDTGQLHNAAWLRFDRQDKNSADATAVLTAADSIYGQQAQNSTNWIRWDVSGPPTQSGNYVQVPVTFVKGSGTPGAVAWQSGLFVIHVAAS